MARCGDCIAAGGIPDMTQANWEGGTIRPSDREGNVVSTFQDRIPVFNRSRWVTILGICLIALAALWFVLPVSGHPLTPRPLDAHYSANPAMKAREPFVAKSHDEEGAAARRQEARDMPGKERDPLVVDQADLFSARDEEALTQRAAEISDRYQVNLVVVTADSARLSEDTRDKSAAAWARDYADDFFDYHQYGEDGVLMLISLDPRQVWISTTGVAIPLFTDARIEHLLDEIFKYADLTGGDYAMAPYIFIDQVELNLEDGWNESHTGGTALLLTKKYLTDSEVKTALLIAAAIASCSFVFIRLRYAPRDVPDIYDVRKEAVVSELQLRDKYVTSKTSTVRTSSSSSSSSGFGGGGGGGSSSHSGSSGGSHGGGGRGF